MKNIYFLSLSYSILVFIVEGKSCPEKTRPHKTRCEAYYKCVDLPPRRHVWIPVKCEEGLIYEQTLHMCVLPPDDWECVMYIDDIDNENEIQNGENYHLIKIEKNINESKIGEPLNTTIIENEAELEKRKDTEELPDNFEGSGDNNDPSERKVASTEELFHTTSSVDPNFTQQLQHLAQLVQGLRKEQENKETFDLRPDHLNTFLTNFNIKNHYNGEGNYFPSPISSTTPPSPPAASTVSNIEEQLPSPNSNGSRLKQMLKPETKLLLSNIFGYPNYYSQQSQETPNISAETLKTVMELSKQLIANQNVPKIVPNTGYYNNQAIIQPVIVPASSLPFPPNFFSLNANYNFPHRPNNYNNKNYKPLKKKPSHTIIHNNVHITAAPNSAEKNALLDSYGLYPPLSAEDQFAHQNNIRASATTMRPSVSTELSVTTVRPFEFQVTPETIANYFTPSPYLTDETVNNLYLPTKSYPAFQYQHYVNEKLPAVMFPPHIDPNKIKIRPNAHHYDSFEHDSEEYATNYGQSHMNNYNSYQPYFMPRPSLYAYNSFSRPANYEDAHMVHFGGNYVPLEIFQKSILPLLGPKSDLTQLEFIHCATGVRQRNVTDCTRYYVCSKKDGKVLSYSCPPYTAFNAQSRVCDARTYEACANTQQIASPYSSSNAMMTLQATAQRKREQALLQMLQYNDHHWAHAERIANENKYIETDSVFSGPSTGSTTTIASTTKRKYYCKEGDKVADQESMNSYFVCFKSEEGRMKGHKMTCPSKLIFCAANSICTLSERCK